MPTVSISSVTDPIEFLDVGVVVAAGTTNLDLGPGGVNTITVSVMFYDEGALSVGPISAVVTGANWTIPPSDLTALADGDIACVATAADIGGGTAVDAVGVTKSVGSVTPPAVSADVDGLHYQESQWLRFRERG